MDPPSLRDRLDRYLNRNPSGRVTQDGLGLDAAPLEERDMLLTLQGIHELHLSPLDQLGDRARRQHDPGVAALKQRLEGDFLSRLDDRRSCSSSDHLGADETVKKVRILASEDLVPPVYDWLAEAATEDEIRVFLALEGGPDGGFDDLVALCQVGLDGEPKLELAVNYWDEMGRGEAGEVHTSLYRRMVRSLDLPLVDPADQPIEGLRRSVLSGVLATNRYLQPEMVGALGTIEVQAGPRCRRVVKALQRISAGGGALDFYEEHAGADPRHGKDWLERVVRPLAADPDWSTGIVRGAEFRCIVNRDFFTALSADPALDTEEVA